MWAGAVLEGGERERMCHCSSKKAVSGLKERSDVEGVEGACVGVWDGVCISCKLTALVWA